MLKPFGQNSEVVLDVGGEGRHPNAWNLNPSFVKTIGTKRGEPIPQHISGRADHISLPDRSVDRLICERTPLQLAALREIARVISPNGIITLRHALCPHGDPHAVAKRVLPGLVSERIICIDGQIVQETEFRPSGCVPGSADANDHEISPYRPGTERRS